MDLDIKLNQNVDTLFSNLESFTQNEGVLGKPLSYEDKTFIPVVSVTMGYGTGNSANKNKMGTQGNNSTNQASEAGNSTTKMGMDALGLGAKLSTDAVIVIDKGNVSMMTLGATSNMSQLIDKIPQMLSGKDQGAQQGQQNQQNQNQQNQQSQQS